MNERLSRWVAATLAHPAGFLGFNLFSLAWFVLPGLVTLVAASVFGWVIGIGVGVFIRIVLPGYLDVVTWWGGATQFTLAWQNQQTAAWQAQQDKKLDAQIDLLVQLAQNEQTTQGALVSQAEAIWMAVASLDDTADELLKLAHLESAIQEKLAEQDERIVTALGAVREMLATQHAVGEVAQRLADRMLDEQGDTSQRA